MQSSRIWYASSGAQRSGKVFFALRGFVALQAKAP